MSEISNGGPALFSECFSLEGKVALVTGASGGLGAHFAETLARAGAEVILAARRRDRLDRVCEAITAAGGRARPLALDVTDAAGIDAAFAELAAGPGRLDILVNNSGIAGSDLLADTSEAEWDRVVDTNLKGAFLVSRAALPLLKASEGAIINIASILGIGVLKRLASYAASKAGLIQLTKAMAVELARDGVRVNAIAPGYVETDLNRAFFETDAGKRLVAGVPMRRLGQASELDGALLLLAGPAGRFMTGATVVVDGGHTLSLS